MFRLPQGGLLIDNPGMRELQLWNDGVDLDSTFTDVAELAALCHYRDCRHEQEPHCAVREALENGTLDSRRFENFSKLQREIAFLESQQDPAAERERKERFRRIMSHPQQGEQAARTTLTALVHLVTPKAGRADRTTWNGGKDRRRNASRVSVSG